MSSNIGNRVHLSVFGESHGTAIGCVIDGLPAGEPLDWKEILIQMGRRAPGRDKTATPRRESDTPRILSGTLGSAEDGTLRTTGAPLAMMIQNENTRSVDYEELSRLPRPGHADYPGFLRYNGYNDVRGGGHFSGRLTAPLVFAGAVCRQILRRRGVVVGGHILEIAGVPDRRFDPVAVNAGMLEGLSVRPSPCLTRRLKRGCGSGWKRPGWIATALAGLSRSRRSACPPESAPPCSKEWRTGWPRCFSASPP